MMDDKIWVTGRAFVLMEEGVIEYFKAKEVFDYPFLPEHKGHARWT